MQQGCKSAEPCELILGSSLDMPPSLQGLARDVKKRAIKLKAAAERSKQPEVLRDETTSPSVKEASDSVDLRPHELAKSPESEKGSLSLDPKLTGAVLITSLLALWRPSWLLLLILLLGNAVLGFIVAALCIYVQRMPPRLPSERRDAASEDVPSTLGLQELLTPAWASMRSIVARRDFKGVVTLVDLGPAPQVQSVRSAPSPCEDVVCYDVGLELLCEESEAPYVQLEVKMPMNSSPFVFRLKLLELRVTAQLYFWSSPPEGRGNGRPYSLVEGALLEGDRQAPWQDRSLR